MNFFKSGIEYNKVAKSFNGLVQMVSLVEMKFNAGDIELEEDIYLLSYLGRKEILDRIEEYKWNFVTPIVISSLGGKTTLMMAYQMTIGKIMLMAEQLRLGDEVNDILKKGELYFELDKSIPDHLKKMM